VFTATAWFAAHSGVTYRAEQVSFGCERAIAPASAQEWLLLPIITYRHPARMDDRLRTWALTITTAATTKPTMCMGPQRSGSAFSFIHAFVTMTLALRITLHRVPNSHLPILSSGANDLRLTVSRVQRPRQLQMMTESSAQSQSQRTLGLGSHQAEMEVKKSRFIGHATHVESWGKHRRTSNPSRGSIPRLGTGATAFDAETVTLPRLKSALEMTENPPELRVFLFCQRSKGKGCRTRCAWWRGTSEELSSDPEG
jgi:hypothetical protein